MSEESFPPVQISVFLGREKYTAPQLVVRGKNVSDVAAQFRNLCAVDEVDGVSPISGLLDDLQTITAAADVKFGVNSPTKTRAAGDGFTPTEVPDDPWAGTNAVAEKRCKHGVMKWREGVSGAGKAYKGHFCPSFNNNDKCPPVWA